MIVIFAIFIMLSLFGLFIEMKCLGDKKNQSTMVEAVEADQPDQVMIEAKKERWALFFYSFSLSRNFEEILLRTPKAIKDKKFEVFNGLKV